jgi:hypothetical protein
MTSVVKRVAHYGRRLNVASRLFDAAGVSNQNAFRQLMDPANRGMQAAEDGGTQGIIDFTRRGDATDPFNTLHSNPLPGASAAPPPATIGDASANVDASRNRRRRRGVMANLYGSGGMVSNSGRQTLG